MQPFPHEYRATVAVTMGGPIVATTNGVAPLDTAAPVEFDGPGDRWSPETLMTAAIGDCLVLTFQAMAKASKLNWLSLDCDVQGRLDRLAGKTRFVSFNVRAQLQIPEDASETVAKRLLEKAEENCLISNSLAADIEVTLEPVVLRTNQPASPTAV